MTKENPKTQGNGAIPPQRKTTLKWSSDGELSSIDMARILDKLSKSELTECDLTCSIEEETD